ncbi:MAG: 5'/3'-nucleotidase SurE [Anaerolineales bacterium]
MSFHILLTNDDGVQAPGLLALAKSLADVGQVTVLAPDRNWSASGHVKTMHRPLRAWSTRLTDGSEALACDGAPSDCVAMGLLGLVSPQVDLVVSGINPSANLGHDVTYSGTVTAAMEAAIAGIPGIAVSLDSHADHNGQVHYGAAAEIARQLADRVKTDGLPDGVFLNVNVPYLDLGEIAGISLTRQGLRVYRDALVERRDPRGRPYYWIGGEAPSGIAEPGTDFWALQKGLVSITPLQLDLTASGEMASLDAWRLDIPSHD